MQFVVQHEDPFLSIKDIDLTPYLFMTMTDALLYTVQCVNALQRLEASFVKEAHLEIARGGSAEFTDLMRVLVSLYLFVTGKFGSLSEGEGAASWHL